MGTTYECELCTAEIYYDLVEKRELIDCAHLGDRICSNLAIFVFISIISVLALGGMGVFIYFACGLEDPSSTALIIYAIGIALTALMAILCFSYFIKEFLFSKILSIERISKHPKQRFFKSAKYQKVIPQNNQSQK